MLMFLVSFRCVFMYRVLSLVPFKNTITIIYISRYDPLLRKGCLNHKLFVAAIDVFVQRPFCFPSDRKYPIKIRHNGVQCCSNQALLREKC